MFCFFREWVAGEHGGFASSQRSCVDGDALQVSVRDVSVPGCPVNGVELPVADDAVAGGNVDIGESFAQGAELIRRHAGEVRDGSSDALRAGWVKGASGQLSGVEAFAAGEFFHHAGDDAVSVSVYVYVELRDGDWKQPECCTLLRDEPDGVGGVDIAQAGGRAHGLGSAVLARGCLELVEADDDTGLEDGEGVDILERGIHVGESFCAQLVFHLMSLMTTVEEFYCLLKADGDEQANDDGGDVDKEVPPGVGGVFWRMHV